MTATPTGKIEPAIGVAYILDEAEAGDGGRILRLASMTWADLHAAYQSEQANVARAQGIAAGDVSLDDDDDDAEMPKEAVAFALGLYLVIERLRPFMGADPERTVEEAHELATAAEISA